MFKKEHILKRIQILFYQIIHLHLVIFTKKETKIFFFFMMKVTKTKQHYRKCCIENLRKNKLQSKKTGKNKLLVTWCKSKSHY